MAIKKTAPKNVAVPEVYDGTKIKELPFPLNVQQRPQMFVGPMDFAGVLTCLREVLNNSVDEFLSGNCTHITLTRTGEWSFEVLDNGRGVPFDVINGKNTLSRIFGTLNAGRNFEEKTVYSTGLNGVGATCVNALSSHFKVESKRGLQYGEISFEEGYEKSLKVGKLKAAPKAPYDKSSTCVSFELAPKFFDHDLEMENALIEALVRETAYLNSGLTINFEDKVTKVKAKLKHTSGVLDYLNDVILADTKPLFKSPIALAQDIIKDTKIEIAFSYDGSFASEKITSFTNTIRTSEGGTHVTGFKRALTQKIIAYVTANKLCKEKVSNDDVYSGLNAIVSVFVFNPKYTSQTKQQLKNTEVMGHVVTFTNGAIDEWLNTNPTEIKIIATKLDLVAKARIAQKRALDNIKKDSSNALASLSNISKFHDCEEQMSGRTEIFFVEG